MKCADCKWYSKQASEVQDLCLNQRAKYTVPGGVRSDPIVVQYTCDAMLAGICRDHQFFEAKPRAI